MAELELLNLGARLLGPEPRKASPEQLRRELLLVAPWALVLVAIVTLGWSHSWAKPALICFVPTFVASSFFFANSKKLHEPGVRAAAGKISLFHFVFLVGLAYLWKMFPFLFNVNLSDAFIMGCVLAFAEDKLFTWLVRGYSSK